MRRRHLIVRLLIVAGILVLDVFPLNVAQVRCGAGPGGRNSGSQDHARLGIDVSAFTDMNGLGFLSLEKTKPWGHIVADVTERILLARGDKVYVTFETGRSVKLGDLFTVFESPCEVDQPLSRKEVEYTVKFSGRLVLKKEIMPRLFEAEIINSCQPIQVGNPIIPFQPISPCVHLASPQPGLSESSGPLKIPVVASKNLSSVLGQFSVLYMDYGLRHGVHRGNLFQILSPVQADPSKDAPLPDEVLGYVLVLDAGPETSTGLVITAKREFYRGTMLKLVDLRQVLKRFLTYYSLHYDKTELENDPLRVLNRLAEQVGPRADLPEAFLLLLKMPKCAIP